MNKIMIAGTRSGSGKTTIASAIMSSIENCAPYKTGPDYIDGGFHTFATGNKSYNLDLFMMGKENMKYVFSKNAERKEIAIVEGAMGLYDGLDNSLDNFSSAHISRVLDIPVILIVDGAKGAASVAAEVLGFKMFDKRVKIAGVIFNRVNSERHYEILADAVKKYTEIESFGYFPKTDGIELEERHLGLVQINEEGFKKKREKLQEIAKKYLKIDKIIEASAPMNIKIENPYSKIKNILKGKRIAIAKDEAFSFYYNSNIDFIKFTGAEIVEFSPIKDKKLPEKIDIIYLGGGYPELYAEELSCNKELIGEIRKFADNGGIIYAECGGFIYLTKGLFDVNKKYHEMCEIFDIEIAMKERLNISRFGYIEIMDEGRVLGRAHEFHYSEITSNNEEAKHKIVKKDGRSWMCGYKKNNVFAGYQHVEFGGNVEFFKKIFNID